MHVDASAMVAILLREDGREALIERLGVSEGRRTSVVSALEAVMAVTREIGDGDGALQKVREFLSLAEIEIEDAGDVLLEALCDAHRRYGKGSGHKARLNLGDCFSYAMAKRSKVPLLYKGNDFAQTDLA